MTETKPQPSAKNGADADSKRRWEERASTKGATLSSVLYRGFSEQLNLYVHNWHVSSVISQLLPNLPRGALVLDLGCGYGRIRQHIAAIRPDLRIIGMDFSENYCHMYAAEMNAETVCADMNFMPFRSGSFDGIIGVTCLMYLKPELRTERIKKILTTLKPSGHALFVDPGLEFMQAARIGLRSTRKTPTGGEGFLLPEYRTLASDEFRVYAVGGMPLFTLLLPLFYLLRWSSFLTKRLTQLIQRRDFNAKRFLKYSLQRWVLLGPR